MRARSKIRQLSLLFSLLALTAAPGARAEPLGRWLERIGRDSPQAHAILADEAAETAAIGRSSLDWRPSVSINGEPKRKQDSTLPVVEAVPKNAVTVQAQQLVSDWGAAKVKRDADAARTSAARFRAQKRLAGLMEEAARGYVAAWKASEAITALRTGANEAAGALTRLRERKASEAEIRAIQGDVLDFTVQIAMAERDRAVALATIQRFGAPVKLVAPSLPRAELGPDASNEAQEAAAQAVAAERDLIAARIARLPKVYAFANYDQVKGEAHPDYTYGVRVTLDLFDKAGTDYDRLKLLADQRAAQAREAAALAGHGSVIRQASAQERSAKALLESLGAVASIEAKRLDDVRVRLKDGKATTSEVVQAVRRVIAARRQLADVTGDLALARVAAFAIRGSIDQ